MLPFPGCRTQYTNFFAKHRLTNRLSGEDVRGRMAILRTLRPSLHEDGFYTSKWARDFVICLEDKLSKARTRHHRDYPLAIKERSQILFDTYKQVLAEHQRGFERVAKKLGKKPADTEKNMAKIRRALEPVFDHIHYEIMEGDYRWSGDLTPDEIEAYEASFRRLEKAFPGA